MYHYRRRRLPGWIVSGFLIAAPIAAIYFAFTYEPQKDRRAAVGADSDSSSLKGHASWTPIFLPFKFVIDSQGTISVEGNASYATPLGTFSIGASYSLPSTPDKILVTIRDRKRGGIGFDSIYAVTCDQDKFVAVVNGKTTISVTNAEILIDVTEANVETIEFRESAPGASRREQISEAQAMAASEAAKDRKKGKRGIVDLELTKAALRSKRVFGDAPFGYVPFGITEAAYDDSTIDDGFLGFAAFIIRLVVAFFAFILDCFLFVVIGLAQLVGLFFGTTLRNVCLGGIVIFLVAVTFVGLQS